MGACREAGVGGRRGGLSLSSYAGGASSSSNSALSMFMFGIWVSSSDLIGSGGGIRVEG